MRRDQLERAIRAACQIIEAPAVIVVGSQAILGTYREEDLPAEATMSMEIDALPIADGDEEVIRLGDLIEGAAGDLPTFESTHGFSIDGVDVSTPRSRTAGATGSSRSRAPIPLRSRASHSSPDSVSRSMISALPSSAPCAKRTATSSARSWPPSWSMGTSCLSACPRLPGSFSEPAARASAWLVAREPGGYPRA